jgi:transcriptional regulator with XRE-family HTH domain
MACHSFLWMTSENGIPFAITGAQCRAARALIGVKREDLAVRSGVPMRTLSRFEDGEGATRKTALAAIRTALEACGVVFIAENGGGAGVRLRVGKKS